MKNIISIQGYKGSGKDEVAKYISYILNTPFWMHVYWLAKLLNFQPVVHRWKITRYADSLKKMLAIMMNVEVSRFEDRDFKENYYFDFNNYTLIKSPATSTISDKAFARELKRGNLDVALRYNLSIRQVLQFFGTEIIRKFFGDKLWIYSTLNSDQNNLIIADQRFIVENEEISKAKYNSYIIHIIREGCIAGSHASEKEVQELYNTRSYSILLYNNGSLKDLFYKCKNIVYCNLLS